MRKNSQNSTSTSSEIGDGDAYMLAGYASDDDIEEDGGIVLQEFVDGLAREGENTKQDSAKINLVTGISMIVGMMIGSGIFASSGHVLVLTQSTNMALIVWIIAGFVSLFGSLSYAELGSIYQDDGGEQVYLLKLYGNFASFLFSWFSCVVGKPSSLAIITLVFAQYFCLLFGGDELSIWIIKFTAIACILTLAILNICSSSAGHVLQNVSTLLKIAALLFMFIASLFYVFRYKPVDSQGLSWKNSTTSPGNFSLAMFHGLWAYDGWNNLNYVVGELKNPSKNLFRSISVAIPCVIVVYLLANISYFISLPFADITGGETVAINLGQRVFGTVGKAFIAITVSISTLGSANASLYTSGRLQREAARSGFVPFASILGKNSVQFGTPVNALILQTILTVIYILSGSYDLLVKLYGFVIWIFYAQTVLGVIVLRYRSPEKDYERPYRVPLVIVVIFLIFNVALIISSFEDPQIRLILLAVLVVSLVGTFVYIFQVVGGVGKFMEKYGLIADSTENN